MQSINLEAALKTNERFSRPINECGGHIVSGGNEQKRSSFFRERAKEAESRSQRCFLFSTPLCELKHGSVPLQKSRKCSSKSIGNLVRTK